MVGIVDEAIGHAAVYARTGLVDHIDVADTIQVVRQRLGW